MTLYVFEGRACINARSPLASLDEARTRVQASIEALRRNGLLRDGATWLIIDDAGQVVERIDEAAA